MISTEDAIKLYKALSANGIQVWVLGGWGIDALLGEQTRPHKDLDLLMLLDDVARICALLGGQGFELKEIWSENRWAIDGRAMQTLTAFVLKDAEDRELDFHAICLDEHGNGIPYWETEEGFAFTKEDLRGNGMIGGYAVRCITAEKQMLCHTGYELPEKQVPDIGKLYEKFGVELPEEHSNLKPTRKPG
jgi:lincosamide nucleotidyltransferase A/C/D/E